MKRIYNYFVSHHSGFNLKYSSPRCNLLSKPVNTSVTPQTSAGNRVQEVAIKTNVMGVDNVFPTSPIVCSSTGEYQISDSLTERGPTFLNIHNGRNGLVMAAQSIYQSFTSLLICAKSYQILHFLHPFL